MATRIISEDLSYYIKVDTKKRRVQPPCRPSSTTSKKNMTIKELAHSWMAPQNETCINADLLAEMTRLKRQLLFSIDIFVNELNLTSMLAPQLASKLMAYHSWSRQAHGMMPLISFLLPLIQVSSSSAHLAKCFYELKDTMVVQDYLETIITYLTKSGLDANKPTAQKWLDTLFEQYRLTLGHYSSSAPSISCLDLYMAYFDMLFDTRRLKCLSWQERKHWMEKEWLTWTPLLENESCDQLEAWMLAKSDTLLNQEMVDLEVNLLLKRNIVWLSESDDKKNIVPASSTIFNFIIDQYTKGKIPNMRLIYGIFGKHCGMLVETGQDTTEIINILGEAQKLILEHLQGPTDVVALLISMVQITLHHMEGLLSYTRWFQSTFTNSSSTCLKSKQQTQIWMKHMETMIPYETTTILQIHAKALADSSMHLQSFNYVSLVKTKLLALGVDATLRQYPTCLDTPLISYLFQPSRDNNNIGLGMDMDLELLGSSSGSSSGSSGGKGKSKSGSGGNNSNKQIIGHQPAELQQLIDRYGETETIPQSLWEDSIFRPKWFKLTFLPALMIDWKPTDPPTLTRRAHMVESFQRKGKVPSSLLVQYQQILNSK